MTVYFLQYKHACDGKTYYDYLYINEYNMLCIIFYYINNCAEVVDFTNAHNRNATQR